MRTFFHQTLDGVEVPDVPRAVRPHLRFAGAALALAILGFAVAGALGNIHGSADQKLTTAGAGALFVVAAVLATRAAAAQLYEVLSARTGPSHAGVLRWLVTIVGYVIVLIAAMGLFAVPVRHLLVGGALTGIIVGIAAQQALGNVFAGVVLLLARPFSVGDAIRVKSGALGGPFEGVVSGMGMTYVTLMTDDGPLSLPNSSLLASAVGPAPGTTYRTRRRFDPARTSRIDPVERRLVTSARSEARISSLN